MNIINEAGESIDMFTVKNKRAANANTTASKESIMDSFNLVPGTIDQSIASLRFSSDYYGQLSTVKVKNSLGQVVTDKYLYNENMVVNVPNVPLNVESTYEVLATFRDGTEMTRDVTILNIPYFGEISKARILPMGDDSFALGWTAYLPNDVLDNYKLFVNGNLKGTALKSESRIDVTGVPNSIKNDVELKGYNAEGVELFSLDFTFGEDPSSVVITADPSQATITEDEEVTITLTVEPNINAIYEIVNLDANLEVISHVKNVFVIKANVAGEYVISFKAIDKDGTGSVSLTVNEKIFAVESITVSGNENMLLSGTQTLEVIYLPENATNPVFVFESSNESILKVNQNGKVTPQAVGQATITVSSGDISGDIVITVTNPVINVTSIEVSGDGEMIVGNDQTLTVTYLPANATNKSFTFSSSDQTIISVTSLGKVKAEKAGTAIITVTNGSVSKDFSITVVAGNTDKFVTSISVTGNNEMKMNDEQTLTVTYEPVGATNADFTYSSSDEEIASVDANGKVKALKDGTVLITVTNGEISQTFGITVLKTVKKGCGSNNAMMLLPLLGVALIIIRKRRFI